RADARTREAPAAPPLARADAGTSATTLVPHHLAGPHARMVAAMSAGGTLARCVAGNTCARDRTGTTRTPGERWTRERHDHRGTRFAYRSSGARYQTRRSARHCATDAGRRPLARARGNRVPRAVVAAHAWRTGVVPRVAGIAPCARRDHRRPGQLRFPDNRDRSRRG